MVEITRRSFVALASFLAAKAPEMLAPKDQDEAASASYVGEWIQKNHGDSWQEAVVTDGYIEVYWVSEDMLALYWAGTFEADGDGTKLSKNDFEKTQYALMASGAETKEFECQGGEIAYEVTAMGMTTTLHLVRK